MGATSGSIGASHKSYNVGIGALADQPEQFAIINTASGDTTLVAATAGKKIRVTLFHYTVTTTAVAVNFQSGTGGTALTGPETVLAGTPNNGGWDPEGIFETASGALLNLHQSGTSQISGFLKYQLVDGTDD